MSIALDYPKTASAAPARANDFDSSLLMVSLLAAIGVLVSTFATIVSPQWFVG
jgi:hypothetical protein